MSYRGRPQTDSLGGLGSVAPADGCSVALGSMEEPQ
jgi:hypothetical protein